MRHFVFFSLSLNGSFKNAYAISRRIQNMDPLFRVYGNIQPDGSFLKLIRTGHDPGQPAQPVVDLDPDKSLFAGHIKAVFQNGKVAGIAAAAKSLDLHGKFPPGASKITIQGVVFQRMPAGISHPEETIRVDSHIKKGAGDDKSRDVFGQVFIPDPDGTRSKQEPTALVTRTWWKPSKAAGMISISWSPIQP